MSKFFLCEIFCVLCVSVVIKMEQKLSQQGLRELAAQLRPQPNNNFDVNPQIQNQERSDCTLGSGRLIPIVFFSLACSRGAPGFVILLATKTRSCSFPTQITQIFFQKGY